jgi:hypothetical protein
MEPVSEGPRSGGGPGPDDDPSERTLSPDPVDPPTARAMDFAFADRTTRDPGLEAEIAARLLEDLAREAGALPGAGDDLEDSTLELPRRPAPRPATPGIVTELDLDRWQVHPPPPPPREAAEAPAPPRFGRLAVLPRRREESLHEQAASATRAHDAARAPGAPRGPSIRGVLEVDASVLGTVALAAVAACIIAFC